MAAITLYGIPNCDITKKAMEWLKKNDLDFSFHDYKKEGISKEKLTAWCNDRGWETIFNKRSTTWRELNEDEQKKIIDQPSAIKLMMEQNSIIKRPIIEYKDKFVVGFKENDLKGLSI